MCGWQIPFWVIKSNLVFFSFMLSLMSLAHRVPHAEASHLALWTQVPSMKRVSPVAQIVKNLPAMWETPFPSLGPEDTLEEGIATHSSFLA